MKRSKKLTSVDKANVTGKLETMAERWVVDYVQKNYPQIQLNHMYVDRNAAMQLATNPKQFDVIVTENMFGDILSEPGIGHYRFYWHASQRQPFRIGVPGSLARTHPRLLRLILRDRARQTRFAQILSGAMMLKYAFGLGQRIERYRTGYYVRIGGWLSHGRHRLCCYAEG